MHNVLFVQYNSPVVKSLNPIKNSHGKKVFFEVTGVSKSCYIGISIPIKYSNFSRFYKKTGSILLKNLDVISLVIDQSQPKILFQMGPGPDGPKRAPNGQKHLVDHFGPFRTLLDHFEALTSLPCLAIFCLKWTILNL